MITSDTMQAEKAILSACIYDGACIATATLEGLRPDDFIDRDFGRVFGLLLDIEAAGQSTRDIVSLAKSLRDISGIGQDIRKPTFLMGLLADGDVHRPHAKFHARLILEAAHRRALEALALDLRNAAADPTRKPSEVREWLEAAILGLQRAETSPVVTLEEAAREFVAEAGRPRGAKRALTGLNTIDRLVGAWCAGELIVLAARPGCGKTAMMTQVARHNAEQDTSVLVVSLEMSRTELAGRVLTADAALDGRLLRTTEANSDDLEALGVAADGLAGLPMSVWAPRGRECTVGRIRAVARMHAARHGLGLLAVDYLQLVAPDDRRIPRHEQIGQMTAGLKNLAGELGCPVLVLAQLNREAEKATAPQLSHLRESGSVEQDADIVLFINNGTTEQTREIIVAKHRHGQVGKVSVEWHAKQTRFADPTPERHAIIDGWNDEPGVFQ